MATPPKKIPGSSSSSVPPSSRTPSPDSLAGSRVDLGPVLPGMEGTGADPTLNTSSASLWSGASRQQSSALVSPMPDLQSPSPTRQVSTQGVSTASRISGADASASLGLQHPFILDAVLAEQLKQKPISPEGIRYDKRKKPYVEMEDGRMVMVRKVQNDYRQTNSREASPTGDWVEYLPDKQKWREVPPAEMTAKRTHPEADLAINPEDAIAGPSKRARLASETDSEAGAEALAQHLLSTPPSPLDLSTRHWKNWGKTTKPESGESIEIQGKHYSIVAQGLGPETRLVYLQHPGFKPKRFDAFEEMLRETPSHQPKWALKGGDQWNVLDKPPFEMPMTQYVSRTFNTLSDHSVQAITRALFDRASLPDGINNQGLSTLALTFRHWMNRASYEPPPHAFSDPLVMLPRTPIQSDSVTPGWRLTLPPPRPDLLQRLDFDPQRFPGLWQTYQTTATPASLRNLFSALLQDNGYVVYSTSRPLNEAALIFHREGVRAVFVLKFPPITADTVRRHTAVGFELTRADFQARLSDAGREALNTHLARDEIIYLLGGIQHSASAPTLFIVREG
ncbi:hypothetical protein PS718_00161 [Pseudomonas fluorescens]|uniref:Uncharacterized protein n=1 Tax=Pseudomonas fluorescens TaxID=294 RepID=A0A5E6ZKT1_PSEFL|nr:hypothetical protein [Pseudomonas fluorescens]VVN66988.1 hypothetical protein PS718_00161 [Pseudomonas fluorescens]